jgi:type IV secretory pathway VirB4 component
LVKIGRILKDYAESGALNALVNLHAAIDDHTFLTKSGELVTFLKVLGADAECLEPLEIDQIVRRFSSATRVFEERFRIYQYLTKADYGRIPHGDGGPPAVRKTVAERIGSLQAHGMYRLEITYALVHEGLRSRAPQWARPSAWFAHPGTAIRFALLAERKIELLETDLDRARQELAHKVSHFTTQLRDFIPIAVMDKQEAFGFLRALLNYTPYKTDGISGASKAVKRYLNQTIRLSRFL